MAEFDASFTGVCLSIKPATSRPAATAFGAGFREDAAQGHARTVPVRDADGHPDSVLGVIYPAFSRCSLTGS
jgi:hypothetical protein